MAARGGVLRLRQSNVQEEAPSPAPARGDKGRKAGQAASSKAAARGDRENPAHGGLCSVQPGSSSKPATAGQIKRRSTKKAVKAAAAGQEGRAEGCSTKKKASESAKVKAGLGCIDVGKSAPGAVAAGAGQALPAEKGKTLTELPMDEVAWILSQVPRCPKPLDEEQLKLFPLKVVESTREHLRLGAEAEAKVREGFLTFQAWVRKEFQEKGVVMVDDEFLAGREQSRQWVREEFGSMFDNFETMFSPSDFGKYSDLYDTDDLEGLED